jgi:protein-tyrosine phosphatase
VLGLVDLHCHILPDIDDGARDLADAVAMAGQAVRDGIEVVCATPHIRHDHDVEIAALAAQIAALNGALESARSPVRIAGGGEVSESALVGLDDEELRAVSLGGGGRWILLEPAPGPLGDSLSGAVGHLHARGFGALIAHPERHLGHDSIPRLAQLVRRGALVQATAAFLLDPDASSGMLALAERGLVHVLGSDAHSARAGRPVALSDALERLTGAPGLGPHREWIAHDAPAAIVRGDQLRAPFAPAD